MGEPPVHVSASFSFFGRINTVNLYRYYTGIIDRVIEEPGFAPRYDVLYDDGDKGRVGSQSIQSIHSFVRTADVAEDELTPVEEPEVLTSFCMPFIFIYTNL